MAYNGSITPWIGGMPPRNPNMPYGSNNVNYGGRNATPNNKRTFIGVVTHLYDNYGLVDGDMRFNLNCVSGHVKRRDKVKVEAVFNAFNDFKWSVLKVQNITDREFESRKRDRIDKTRGDIDKKRFKPDNRQQNSNKGKEKSEIIKSPSARNMRTRRYAVKVPNDLLEKKEIQVFNLNKRFENMHVPSDFISAHATWLKSFPRDEPFTYDKPCLFHIKHKDVEAPFSLPDKHPFDADYAFSAKVMLLNLVDWDELMNKCIVRGEELNGNPTMEKVARPFCRAVEFLVGLRNKTEVMAIGGPWSESEDGPNPESDPAVLVRTAIRTCRDLTGINLTSCVRWYRFLDLHYHRGETAYDGKTYPARLETVSIFVPDLSTCVPSVPKWIKLCADYDQFAQAQIDACEKAADEAATEPEIQTSSAPVAVALKDDSVKDEANDKEELMIIDKVRLTEKDLKSMKVVELRQELQLRNLSVKGTKAELMERLLVGLKEEEEKEREKTAMKAAGNEKEKAKEEVVLLEEGKQPEEKMEVDETLEMKKEEKKAKAAMSEEDKAALRRRFKLPDKPHIIVHPSKSAKNGKFDCGVMTMMNLMNYTKDDVKEHSFEVFLFVELFYTMMQRDFGYTIYKALCELPEKPAEVEEKEILAEAKNEDEGKDKEGSCEEMAGTDNDKDDEKKEEANQGVQKKAFVEGSEMEKDKESMKMVTVDPELLLAFTFFDRGRCGYINERDLETLCFALGLHLSTIQTRKLISKATTNRDMVEYRKWTDKRAVEIEDKAGENGEKCIKDDQVDEKTLNGNLHYLSALKDEIKKECKKGAMINKTPVDFKNVWNSIRKFMEELKKKNILQLKTEKMFFTAKKDYDTVKDNLKKAEERELQLKEKGVCMKMQLEEMKKLKVEMQEKADYFNSVLSHVEKQISDALKKYPKKGRTSFTPGKVKILKGEIASDSQNEEEKIKAKMECSAEEMGKK